jgi:hypothetical protein
MVLAVVQLQSSLPLAGRLLHDAVGCQGPQPERIDVDAFNARKSCLKRVDRLLTARAVVIL